MNRIYRLVWSQASQGWVAVAENAKAHGKAISGRKLVAAALALTAVSLAAPSAQAGPSGGQVTAGSGTIAQTGTSGATTTTITQTTQNLSLNWQSFNIGAQETVDFVQPSASSIAVNRIFDTNGTQILGQLNANGQVFLINPNGIVFGQGAQVNVGGLVASTLDVNGTIGTTTSFGGTGSGSVINQGTINTINGGYVALLGNHVANQGTITAQLGSVALGAGSAVTLTFAGNSLLHMQVDQSVLNSLAENGGLIQADGGQVLMSAGAKDALLASVVNNTGVIEARTVDNQDGNIVLLGSMTAGTVNVGGTLDASAPHGGNGGAIETSAASVKIANGATVTTAAPQGLTGSWLLDPDDFTIAASGGDITGAALGTLLGSNSVTISTTTGTNSATNLYATASGSGNINVNDVVSWSANKLTLNAQNNININANLNGSGTASLALQYGQGAIAAGNASNYILGSGVQVSLPAGLNFSTQLGSNGTPVTYTVITSLGAQGSTTGTDLQGMTGNLTGNYALGADIDASATSGWNTGAGFTPIGNSTTSFTGSFQGLGHTITDITSNQSMAADFVGLFGSIGGSVIRDVGLINATVSGGIAVGGLVGNDGGTISNSYVTGTVTGVGNGIGGLVGQSTTGTITSSYASATVSGDNGVGGLVGSNGSTISNSHAAGTVSGWGEVGGLAGISSSTISTSYATSAVTGGGGNEIGGLVGYNTGTISTSYASGAVSGGSGNDVGGLVGENDNTIGTSYAIGTVTGGSYVGGLVGKTTSSVDTSYATGTVTGSGSYVGGLTGCNCSLGQVINSYWDSSVMATGIATGPGSSNASGLSTATLQQQASYDSSWNFSNTWILYPGQTAPLLRAFMTSLIVTANNATASAGSAYSGGNGVTYSVTPNANLLGTVGYSGTSQGASAAGSYVITPGGLYSNQQGYIISYVNGTLTLNQEHITLSVSGESADNKVYNGTASATLIDGSLVGVLPGDSVTLVQAGSFASVNVGTGIAVTASDTLIVGSDPSGAIYTLAQPSGLAANITQASLSVSGQSAASKVYNGNTIATLSGGSLVGVIGSDAVTLTSGAATFASKNVGNNITVTASDSLSGSAAADYTLVQPTLSANITPALLTVTGESAANKVYNGNTTATLTGGSLVGVVAGDAVTLTQSGNFASQNVGSGISVTASDSLSGSAAANYSLAQPTGLTASITPASLTIAGESVASKVYDGNTAATLSGGILMGVVAGDAVTLTQTGNFASRNVGSGIAVTASDSLSGAAAANYTLIEPNGLSANITQATLSYVTSATNAYSGTTPTGLSGTVSGFAAGDTFANAVSGALQWSTPVGIYNLPGQYAIDGSGLTAANYVFVQASGNAHALNLVPGIPTPPVKNAMSMLESPTPPVPPGNSPQNVNPVLADASCNTPAGQSSACGATSPTVVTQSIGAASLHIVAGGVSLPAGIVLLGASASEGSRR